ncbi:MAG: hypothetical protein Q9182_000119 [Xanthomendoza sp. 2 TL-2023]
MTSDNIVQDSFLLSVLAASTHAREQCMQLIDLAEQSAVASTQTLPPETKLHLSTQQRQLNADLASLRLSSRDSILEVRTTKQDTAEARQEIDRLHLHLQNLYYEERHLRAEKFLHLEPEHLQNDERSLMFARINHELAEREALEQQRQALLKRKQGLIADNKKRKDDLASLDKDLETFIDVHMQIHMVFRLPADRR